MVQSVQLDTVLASLKRCIGAVEAKSDVFDFSFTEYYCEEMGPDLKKMFVSFNELIDPDALPFLKHRTNDIESDWMMQGHRQVNLDPGYITGAKLVLASTKDFAHRVYIGDGIYGDNHLRFVHGAFVENPWTYPDYKIPVALRFFTEVRQSYLAQKDLHGKEDEL